MKVVTSQKKQYSCDDWKREFMKAASMKLRGHNAPYVEKILYKMSPCDDNTVQETLMNTIYIHNMKYSNRQKLSQQDLNLRPHD